MGHNATQGGSSTSYRHDDMHYFDQLPPTARAALANAAFNWSSGAVLGRWKRGVAGYKTGQDIAKSVKRWDANVISPAPKRRKQRR